jgi:hypothetical protein
MAGGATAGKRSVGTGPLASSLSKGLPHHRRSDGAEGFDRLGPTPDAANRHLDFTMSKSQTFERPEDSQPNPILQILFDPFLF